MKSQRNKKAEMGVGTLIIFIALLLVAAVAAGVLIQTAGSLQQRALSTGNQATGQISTSAIALEVSATDGTNAGGITNFSTIIKLAPGSDPIKLDELTASIGTVDQSIVYQYRPPTNTSDYANYCGAGLAAEDCVQTSSDSGNFTVEYLQQGSNYQSGVLVRGDVIRMYLNSASAIDEGEYVRIGLIPKIGVGTTIEFDTPDVMSTQRVYLYP